MCILHFRQSTVRRREGERRQGGREGQMEGGRETGTELRNRGKDVTRGKSDDGMEGKKRGLGGKRGGERGRKLGEIRLSIH